jgi:hypothetical protein
MGKRGGLGDLEKVFGEPVNMKDPAFQTKFKNYIELICKDPDYVATGNFGKSPVYRAEFYIRGKDVVVVKPDGEFVTFLENGINQSRLVREALGWPSGMK